MIIKELNLIGFGKFKNREIQLKEGINIVYGENEDGKSTIHNFIDGMFYGFLKPYVKRTIYLDEHERYRPWHDSKYAGIIKFFHNDEAYRIEREFTKSNENTKVLIDATGEDITNSIDNGEGRVLQPGNHFFGFNQGVYSNTISIKQLENKTDDLLANEVRDRLANISTSLDDELSVENVVEDLEEKLKEIGTIRAGKSLYGSIYRELEEYKREKEEILNLREEYFALLEKSEEEESNLNIKIQNLEKIKKELEEAKAFSNLKTYKEALELQRQIDIEEKKIEDNKKYKNLNEKVYVDIVKVENKIESLKENILQYTEDLKEVIREKNLQKSEQLGKGQDENKVIEKYIEYENLEEDREKFFKEENINHLEFLKRDFEHNKKSKSKYKSTLVIAGIVFITSLLGSIFLKNYLFLSVNIISIPLGIFSLMQYKKANKIIKRIKREINTEQERREQIKNSLDSISERQKNILDSLGLDSKGEFKSLENRIQNQIFRREENKKTSKTLDKKIGRYKDEIERLEKDINKSREKIDRLLRENSSKNLEELKRGLECKKIYQESMVTLKNRKEVLDQVLKENTLEVLKTEAEKYRGKNTDEKNYRDIENIKNDIDEKTEEISNIKIQNSKLEERLNSLGDKIENLVVIDENIDKSKRKLQNLDEKRESIELAKETLMDISKEIHREFAPKLNKTIGKTIEKITDGKYSTVKVDEKLELGIMNPDSKKILDIDSLSGGTIDQLYFALRFGIAESFNRESLPLILDDCFIQYDNIRLKNIIKLLIDKSKSRQIILFTCHRREISILDEMEVSYNLIDLT